jgi:hypothetical protein
MTTDLQTASPVLTPFLLRFAEQIEHAAPQLLRYDEARQIAQVQINGTWVDTPDALEHTIHSTRLTKVQAETTDDE